MASGTAATVPAEHVGLEFPGQRPGGQAGRVTASRLDLGPAGAGVDVAVLDLGEDQPVWLPAPVSAWSAGRPPARVRVFGYPLAEGPLSGVWRQFAVAGPATTGTVQLDWTGDAGTFPGHSGGPVIDSDGHALAGILVEGSGPGRFDRFMPVTLIAEAWPQMPRPWLVTGADPGEARSHFARRARGQRSIARGGDLFRGRDRALAEIRNWLTAEDPPGQSMVITGQPGAGKSAVLARAVLDMENGQVGPGLAFHARGSTIGHFLAAMADLTCVDALASADELITALANLPRQPPLWVALDALDEAASDLDRSQIAGVLTELAVLPGLRVAVATRPLAAGNPFAPGRLLPALGVQAQDDRNLIDLDSSAYADPEALRKFAAALLAQDSMEYPAPPGAAWMHYRSQHGLRDQLATMIAQRAGGNFLVAAMAAVPLSTRRGVIDPADEGFDPAIIPSGIGEALHKFLDQMPAGRRDNVRGLLTALAYARGAGLDDATWLAFAAALGYRATVAELDGLRRSPAADYLLQVTPAETDTRPMTRLFHQALTDELLTARHQPSDESILLDVLLRAAQQTGWQAGYPRDHVAEHAAAAGRLDQLLEDAVYLVAVDPTRLLPYLGVPRSAPARAAAAVYRQSAHSVGGRDQMARASQLELAACQLGCRVLAARIAGAFPGRPWQTRWSHSRRTAAQTLPGHIGWVQAVTIGELQDGTPVIVSGGGRYDDGEVRVWRLADGAPVGEPITGHDGSVNAVAAGVLPDRTPAVVVVSGSGGRVDVRRLADGTRVGGPIASGIAAVAVGALPDRTPVIVSGGEDGEVRVWRLADGAPVGEPITGHRRAVNAVAVGALPDRTPVIVSGGEDGEVRVWRLADGAPVGEPITSYRRAVNAVAVGALPDRTPVIVSGGEDGEERVWRLADGAPVGEPITGHDNTVNAVAVGVLPDRTPVIVSGGEDGQVRVWRLADGAPVGEPLTGHDGRVNAVAVGSLPGDTPVIVSGSGGIRKYDEYDWNDTARILQVLRVWRPAGDTSVGEPIVGHDNTVNAVAVGVLPDRTPVIVSGGEDGQVRVWRLANGAPVGEPITGHNGAVNEVAVAALPDGTRVIVSRGEDGEVRVWRLADGSPVGEPIATYGMVTLQVAALPDGTSVILTGGSDPWGGVVEGWRLGDSYDYRKPLTARHGGVRMLSEVDTVLALAIAALPDGTPVVIGGGENGGDESTVEVWRLLDGQSVGNPWIASITSVTAVATGILPDGTPVVVSGGGIYDGTVQVWRLVGGAPVTGPLTGHEDCVQAVAVVAHPDHAPVIVSAGRDGTLRAWQLADGTPVGPPLELPGSVKSIAVHGKVIVTATGTDIAVHDLELPPAPRR
jgi:WD40 repeat protein